MQVVAPHSLRPYDVASCMGGGFGRGGDADAGGVLQGKGGAVAVWELAPNEICRLPPLQQV